MKNQVDYIRTLIDVTNLARNKEKYKEAFDLLMNTVGAKPCEHDDGYELNGIWFNILEGRTGANYIEFYTIEKHYLDRYKYLQTSKNLVNKVNYISGGINIEEAVDLAFNIIDKSRNLELHEIVPKITETRKQYRTNKFTMHVNEDNIFVNIRKNTDSDRVILTVRGFNRTEDGLNRACELIRYKFKEDRLSSALG